MSHILDFIKPDKVLMTNSDEFVGNFEFKPLEPGFGLTIGNSIRRVLLSSLEGIAITSIKIKGVDHEFSTIEGVVEDVTDIILNLKQVRFKRVVESEKLEKISLKISKSEVFTAKDLNSELSYFQVVNEDFVICNLNSNAVLQIDMKIESGRGFRYSEQNETEDAPIGTIAIDSIFTPIKNVKYHVEDFRVGQRTDYENLKIEITTDGSITPKDSLTEAAKILIHHFMLFSDTKISIELPVQEEQEEFDESTLHLRQLLKKKLTEMDLSVRALNCLKSAEVSTIGELISFEKSELLKFRNFGKKSLIELEELVVSKGLSFGMDVDKYMDN